MVGTKVVNKQKIDVGVGSEIISHYGSNQFALLVTA
jgi:hypothetical protein